MPDEYEMQQRRAYVLRKLEFAFAQVLKLIFYILGLLVKMFVLMIKGVLKVVGINLK